MSLVLTHGSSGGIMVVNEELSMKDLSLVGTMTRARFRKLQEELNKKMNLLWRRKSKEG